MVLLQVFTHKNYATEFFRLKLIFIHQNDKFTFCATLWGLRNNVRTSCIVRWKARSRLPIRDIWTFLWTFFASSYGWDVISRYWSKSALLDGVGGSLWVQILGERGRRPHLSLVSENYSILLPHSEDRMILSSFVWVQYQRVTNRRTDKRTELPWLIQRSALQAMRPSCKNRGNSESDCMTSDCLTYVFVAWKHYNVGITHKISAERNCT